MATYQYNFLGQRAAATTTSTVNYHYGRGRGLLAESASPGAPAWREYIWLDGMPVGLSLTGTVYFVHPDHLDSPRLITNGSQNIVWSWSHDPFWQGVRGSGTISGTDQRFPGQYYDSGSGFDYNYFRDYDATSGRYIESDPIGLAGGVNTYSYAAENPLTHVDPSGLQEFLARPPAIPDELGTERLKVPRPGLSPKEGATDVPSWCRGMRPRVDESGKDFAKRLLDEKYGPDNYKKGPGSEYNQIQKWGDRNFQDPKGLLPGIDNDPA